MKYKKLIAKIIYVLSVGAVMTILLRITVIKEKKVGRNDPCPCGSGKK